MAKLIVVCGATGQVGGSAARRMLKEGWQVRAITRNKDSSSSKALADAGAETCVARYDDIASLEDAFKGATAIFAVTNGTLDNLLQLGPESAAETEYQQLMNIAMAASRIKELEHLIMHTLPSGVKMADIYVPHMDTKDRAADDIRKNVPDLAKKTTFMWIGLFDSNFWTFPMMTPVELPGSYGSHIYVQPCKPSTRIYACGSIDHNVGSFVNAILQKPSVSQGKYALLHTGQVAFKDMLADWSEVSGKRAVFLQCSRDEYEDIWGPYGKELGLQFEALEAQSDWSVGHKDLVIDAIDLEIPHDDLLGLKAALEKNKEKL